MFYDKLNYKEDGFYSVVDQVELVNGEYKGVLNHDHVDRGTILIIDEEGNEIKDYFISDNPEKPWETEIELFGSKGVKTAYIHYNTKGDIVDADDINKIQDAISEDDGALDKVKEDIIVLKETKSDKRYVDRELDKKVDTSEFSDTVDKLADKEETQRQLNNKIEWVNNMSGKRVTLYGNMIDTEWGSGKTITDELNKKADKTYVDDELKKKADFDYVLSLDFDIGDLQDEKADKDYVEEKISNINIDQFKAIDKGGYSFDNLKEPGVFRLWNRNTSPCGGTSDYIVVVYKYSNKIIQVAHSSTTSSDIENRAYTRYYTGTRWTNWRELTNVDIEKEIDEVKQSGVETNRILVDALNSKNVWASTSSSIKNNARKVNDIKMGDYSIGDIVKPENVEKIYISSKVWEFTGHTNSVNSVAVDSQGYVYSGSRDEKVMKISPDGSKVWEFTGHNNDVNSVAVDSQGYVYSGGNDSKVMKISPQGNKVWEFTGHGNWVDSVAVDSQGYVYSGSRDEKVMKISPNGNKVWEFTGHTHNILSVAVDNDGYIYSGSVDSKVMKISPNGNKVWEFTGHTNSVTSVAVDSQGYVYSGGRDKKVMKISPNGNKVWEFTGHTNSVTSVAVDNDGYIYSGSVDSKVMKISPDGSKVWEFTGHNNDVNSVAVDSQGYVYSGSRDEKVMKISPGKLIAYKLIA